MFLFISIILMKWEHLDKVHFNQDPVAAELTVRSYLLFTFLSN